MSAVAYQDSSYRYQASQRSRAASALAALATIALMLLMLIRMGALPRIAAKEEVHSTTFRLPPERKAGIKQAQSILKPVSKTSGGAPKKINPIAKAPPTPAPPAPWQVIPMTKEQFAASDISKMPSRETAGPKVADGGQGTGSGKGNGAAYGPSDNGSGGEELFDAQVISAPSFAQVAFYIPEGMTHTMWGEMKCRMVPPDHVDNCTELGESPGSGMARAMRRSSYLFVIHPPRIGNRSLADTWVRVRYTYTVTNEKEDSKP